MKKANAQKQECGYPSLQPFLRSHTHAFSLPTLGNIISSYRYNLIAYQIKQRCRTSIVYKLDELVYSTIRNYMTDFFSLADRVNRN